MIGTIVRIEWLNLKRDYVALGLSLVLPVIFFTISALVFGGVSSDEIDGRSVRVLVVDQDASELSLAFIAALDRERGIETFSEVAGTNGVASGKISPEAARLSIQAGTNPMAIVIPAGFGDSFGSPAADDTPVRLLYDASNPVAREMLEGMAQSAAISAGWSRLAVGWLERIFKMRTPDVEAERLAVQQWIARLRTEAARGTIEDDAPNSARPASVISVVTEDVRGEQGDVISYSAAGIGVMFLLFSMSGAGGSILEEVETGTLERLLNSAVGLGQVLLAKWIFFTCFAIVQLTVMFVWGAVFFGVDLSTPKRLAGFAVMTGVTAGAAASFGIFLATVCRTRSQLGGVSTILILIMSALGGSMVPRFLMPDFMKFTSRLTFNGWALDGYLKVFWYGDPNASLVSSLATLAPEVSVLGTMTVVLLSLAYFFSRRWMSL